MSTVTRAFSLPSSALRYLLGYSLVHADHVVVCSPWISNVEVRLPLGTEVDDSRRVRFVRAIEALDATVDVYVRADEEAHNDYTLSRLDAATVTVVDDLHAKAVVTDEYVYVGSANITRGGLLTNKELCKVLENDYGDAKSYVEAELELSPGIRD